MSVIIESPKSISIDRSNTNECLLSWSLEGGGTQTAYEILYKLKQDDSWSTMGKVEDTSTTYNLMNIYNKQQIDLQEFYYRVIIYSVISEPDGSVTHNKDYSEAFSILFRDNTFSFLKVFDGEKVNSFPIQNQVTEYPENGDNTIKSISIMIGSETKKIALVKDTHPHASKLKIQTDEGKMDVMRKECSFKPSGFYENSYIDRYQKQYEPTYDYKYYNNYSDGYYNYTQYYYPIFKYASYDYQETGEDSYTYQFTMPTGGYHYTYYHEYGYYSTNYGDGGQYYYYYYRRYYRMGTAGPFQSYTTMSSNDTYYYSYYKTIYYYYIPYYSKVYGYGYYYYISSTTNYEYISGYKDTSYSYYYYS